LHRHVQVDPDQDALASEVLRQVVEGLETAQSKLRIFTNLRTNGDSREPSLFSVGSQFTAAGSAGSDAIQHRNRIDRL
jgi:hypothetical protein